MFCWLFLIAGLNVRGLNLSLEKAHFNLSFYLDLMEIRKVFRLILKQRPEEGTIVCPAIRLEVLTIQAAD